MTLESVEHNGIASHLTILEALHHSFQYANLNATEKKFMLESDDFQNLLTRLVAQEYVAVEELKKSAWWLRTEVTEISIPHGSILSVYANVLGYREWRYLIGQSFAGRARNLRYQPPAIDFIHLPPNGASVSVTYKRRRNATP